MERNKKRKSNEHDTNAMMIELQSKAANRQIATVENRNILDFLHLAQESKFYSDSEMRAKFAQAEERILTNVDDRKSSLENLVTNQDVNEDVYIDVVSNGSNSDN